MVSELFQGIDTGLYGFRLSGGHGLQSGYRFAHFVQCRFHLRRYALDEPGLLFAVLGDGLDDLLQLPVQEDETHDQECQERQCGN